MGDSDALTISHTLADLRVWDFSLNSLSETNIAVGCHLVNLALEEISVEFHSTIFTLGIMSKLLLHSLNQMVRCRRQGQDGSRNRISPQVFQSIGGWDAPVGSFRIRSGSR